MFIRFWIFIHNVHCHFPYFYFMGACFNRGIQFFFRRNRNFAKIIGSFMFTVGIQKNFCVFTADRALASNILFKFF